MTQLRASFMPLIAGSTLGSYEIVAPLGAGGMGEVFRARDLRLGRDVALKVLPDLFNRDPDRLARFKREAQLLAALNHPNIAAIYGLEDSNPSTSSGQAIVWALVLELVEGVTLADRLAEGPIPIDEAIPIGRQIGAALEAAHQQGIIHRDLKPANVKVRPDGTVKVLDFGLAKALDPATPAAGQPAAATITSPAQTRMGVILGTAAYMSPEQARGRAADKRSDIWAFGCVLFEMLAGRRPFEGQEVSDTLASVLKSDPEWHALPSALPPSVRALVEGCLKKDPHDRIADISTARFVLSQPLSTSPSPSVAVKESHPRSMWGRVLLMLAGAAIGAAAFAAMTGRNPPPPALVTKFAVTLPGQQFTLPRQAVAISPDGTRIAYAADGRLYLRSLSSHEVTAIAGTEGAINPMFSPDGQEVAFWAESSLKRIALGGSVPVTIPRGSQVSSGGWWDRDGIMIAAAGSIVRVSPQDGKSTVVIAANRVVGRPDSPQMLPGGRTVLYTLLDEGAFYDNRWDSARIVVQSIDGGEPKTLLEGGSDARYVPTGHIVYALRGTLLAMPFDLATLSVTGGSVPVIEGVRRSTAQVSGAALYAFSDSGSMVYVPGATSEQETIFIYDRQGVAHALPLPPGSYRYPRVSPDGSHVAFDSRDNKESFVSVYNLSSTTAPPRITFGSNNRYPIWSGDGKHLAFQSDREGAPAVFWQAIGSGSAERLTTAEPGTSHVPESWSRDGVLLYSVRKGTAVSLWSLSIADRQPKAFGDVASHGLPTNAAFSPDGDWVAYQIGVSDSLEGLTYVQAFPANGNKREIGRGGRPVWSRDGTLLYFVPAPGQFQMVQVTLKPTFSFTSPVAVPRPFGIAGPGTPRTFDFFPDGRIIGVGAAAQGPGGAELRVVLNWFEELKARVPGR
jgi:eukaryotic-like serine/threonine-protein kinase